MRLRRLLARVGPMVAVVVIVGVVLGAAGLVLTRDVLHGRVDASSLSTSVARASPRPSGLAPAGGCGRIRRRLWRCSVPDEAVSGYATYMIRVRPRSSCWAAYRGSGRPAETAEFHGCVRLW